MSEAAGLSYLYLKLYLSLAALGMLMVISFNVVVDPLSTNRWITIKGFNADKPQFGNHVRQGKAFVTMRLQPEAIILGSSKAEVGLDPRHPAFGDPDKRRYNLAVPSASIAEVLQLFQHARASGQLKIAVVGLDFFMFNVHKPKVPGQEEPIYLKNGDTRERLEADLEMLRVALSLSTLSASVATVLAQDREIVEYDDLGARLDAYEENVVRRLGSTRAAFRFVEASLVKDTFFPPPNHKFAFSEGPGISSFDAFERLLAEARAGGIDLTLMISPEHARQLEVIRAAGLWPQYEQWKRTLVRITEAEARIAGRDPYAIWDFSGYSEVTTEPVPAGENAYVRMHWYWESSHYRKEVGNAMLDRMIGKRTESFPSAIFGVRLSSQTIDHHLADIRAARERYHQAQPAEAIEVEGIVCALRPDCVRAGAEHLATQ